jgi:hypothetical protein
MFTVFFLLTGEFQAEDMSLAGWLGVAISGLSATYK